MENQPVEDAQSVKITWRIKEFSRLSMMKLYSSTYELGGVKWRLLIFPRGNNVDFLSMYMGFIDSANLPYGWSRYAHFSLTIVNQFHSSNSIRKETKQQLNAGESDWGFTSFMPLNDLYDASQGFIVNDICVIKAEIAIYRATDQYLYKSKRETSYVGLKNEGATCYMNSLLQMLFHIPYFRKVVYHMPTSINDEPSTSIPMALQSLFYKLQHSESSVGTKDLTRSFGWDTHDAFLQHDVHELNRVLCEKLEEKMKRTVVEGAIQHLFEGHHKNYIECINVDYKSSRQESFYADVQLDVKGCHDVYASFDKYVAIEHLDADNKYHAGKYGLQDAKKGVLFIDFPPVLQLHLKRYEYEFIRDGMVKINKRYEFPLELDLDRDNGKYLSPEANRRVRNLYTLHSVFVHSGGVHGGHYYTFIRPTLSNQWYKFDDERVTKEDITKALDELYGGEEEHVMMTNLDNATFKFTRQTNAYMLVYIRESDKDKILCDIDERDMSQHLKERLKREQKEKELKRKEKAEADMYMIVKVVTDEDFARQIGKGICFDLVDHAKVRSFRVQKLTPFHTFKEEIAREFHAPVYFQRFWLWGKRQNKTHRPNRPLTLQEESNTVGHLKRLSSKNPNDELWLFLEVERAQDLHASPLPDKKSDDILLLFKLYEPEKGELRYTGRLFVKSYDKPAHILEKLNKLAGYAPNEDIELFEEIKFEPKVMCTHIDTGLTFTFNQLEDGDIVWYQKSLPAQTRQLFRCPDIPSFLEYQHSLQLFSNLHNPKNLLNEASFDETKNNVKISTFLKFFGYPDKYEISGTFLPPYLDMDEHASQADFYLTFLPPDLNMDKHAHHAHYFYSFLPLELDANEHVHHTYFFLTFHHLDLDTDYHAKQAHFFLTFLHLNLERPRKDEFCLQLSKLDSYDEVVARVANQLRVDDPSKLWLTSHNIYSQRLKAHSIKYRVENLSEILMHYDQLETHNIRLPIESTVGDVLEHLKEKVKLSRPSAKLRLLEGFSHKIYKVFNY
ncbi:UNVERIFIED_CONTAM: Ubiquitin carboxyl-terminal hydrolase 13 [Sesamum calycinum]|uniref:ubiquitinyl hydrolase 1 n=1 Tax=Sesamum calycinum TaxID=2727403 RepID=A0AAW2QL09_9LAMI